MDFSTLPARGAARLLLALVCVALSWAAWCLPALAGPGGVLVVARGDIPSPPLEYEQDGEVLGLHADLLRGAAVRLGMTVEFHSVPWARALHLARAGQVDAVSFVTRTPEREAEMLFLEGNVLRVARNVFIALRGSDAQRLWTGDLTALAGLRLGLVREFAFGGPIDTAPDLRRVEVESTQALPGLLLRGRVDLALVEEWSFLGHLQGDPVLERLAVLEPPVSLEPQYLAFSIAAARGGDLPLRFAAALAAFRASPEGQALVARALGPWNGASLAP